MKIRIWIPSVWNPFVLVIVLLPPPPPIILHFASQEAVFHRLHTWASLVLQWEAPADQKAGESGQNISSPALTSLSAMLSEWGSILQLPTLLLHGVGVDLSNRREGRVVHG